MTDHSNPPQTRIVPLKASLFKRFYEPVMLLACLQDGYRTSDDIAPPEPEVASSGSQEQSFHDFVDQLSRICDSRVGGATATSFAVLQLGIVQYRFASSRRSSRELDDVKAYVTDILSTIGRTPESALKTATPQSTLFSEILQKIIHFNRHRIEYYTRTISCKINICIETTFGQDADDARAALQYLDILRPLVQFAMRRPKVDDAEFVSASQVVLNAIDRPHISDTHSLELFRYKARVEREGPNAPWRSLYHTLGCLHSYLSAVKVFFSTFRLWPSLFVDFEVIPVPSSQPDSHQPVIRKSVSGILRRMTSDPGLVELCRSNASSFQMLGIDDKIGRVTQDKTFRPIVYPEVLVDDSIRRSSYFDSLQGPEPCPFFNEDKFGRYIGSSKRTCLLCSLYFAARSIDSNSVKVRASHRNLYRNWRLPDVSEHDNTELGKQRSATLERMIIAVRDETAAAIRNRIAVVSFYDSDDSLSNQPFGGTSGDTVVAILDSSNMDKTAMSGESLVRVEEYGSMPVSTPRDNE